MHNTFLTAYTENALCMGAERKVFLMTDLKCSVDNCIYNAEHLCNRGDICVGGKNACCSDETCCESFAQHREGTDSFTSSITHPSRNVSIDCEAVNCIYNRGLRCSADHVDITGCGACGCGQTACETFAEK